MPTKYDVFARIIENSPVKQKDLDFDKPVYAFLNNLEELGFIKKTKSGYVPIKNKETLLVFEIIKISLKIGINYNLFLKPEFANVILQLNKSVPNLRPKAIKNNQSITKMLNYLEQNQFILLVKKRPMKGTLVKNKLITLAFELQNKKIQINEIFSSQAELKKELLRLPRIVLNPFDKNYFAHITGSAQLEGSTITEGETVEIIMKDIYPDKSPTEIQMIKNLNEAMQFIMDILDEPITPKHIKEINKRIMFSLHRGAGSYKKTQNKIQGNPSFKTTAPNLVPFEIEKFCKEFNEIRDRGDCLDNLGELHNQIQRIHPFSDGNSRTTRMIINWLLAKFEFPILVIRNGSFERYMDLTKLATARYDSKLAIFLYHLLLHESLLN